MSKNPIFYDQKKFPPPENYIISTTFLGGGGRKFPNKGIKPYLTLFYFFYEPSENTNIETINLSDERNTKKHLLPITNKNNNNSISTKTTTTTSINSATPSVNCTTPSINSTSSSSSSINATNVNTPSPLPQSAQKLSSTSLPTEKQNQSLSSSKISTPKPPSQKEKFEKHIHSTSTSSPARLIHHPFRPNCGVLTHENSSEILVLTPELKEKKLK